MAKTSHTMNSRSEGTIHVVQSFTISLYSSWWRDIVQFLCLWSHNIVHVDRGIMHCLLSFSSLKPSDPTATTNRLLSKGAGHLFCTARHSRFLRAQSPPSPFYIGTGLMFHPAAQLREFITRWRWTEIVASLQHVVLQESDLLHSINTVWNLFLITTVS